MDAANPRSYPGSGTVWTNISSNNINGVLTNGPTYNSSNLGSIVFDGVDDYVACGNYGSWYTQGTVSFWMYSTAVENYRNPFTTHYVGGNTGLRFEQNSAGTLSVVYGNDVGTYTGYILLASGLLVNTWYHVVSTWNTSGSSVIGYLNGAQMFNSSNTYWATTMPTVTVGNGFSTGRYFAGRISNVQLYNQALSATDVAQNFNALRGRYGI
jgi:hypothetical protein